MTAIVTLEHARPNELVRIARPASTVGESTVNLQPGERIPVRDLLAAALIQSANDSAFALAAHVGGKGGVPAFVRMMNRRAQELGLTETHFVRPDGLDVPGHVSSAVRRPQARPRGDAPPARARARPQAHRDDRRRAPPLHLERPARRLSRADRGQDGPHRRRRLVRGGRGAAGRRDDLRRRPRKPRARRAERRPRRAPRLGLRPLRPRDAGRGGEGVRDRGDPLPRRREPVARGRGGRRGGRPEGASAGRARGRAGDGLAARPQGRPARRDRRQREREGGRAAPARRRRGRGRAGVHGAGRLVRWPRPGSRPATW